MRVSRAKILTFNVMRRTYPTSTATSDFCYASPFLNDIHAFLLFPETFQVHASQSSSLVGNITMINNRFSSSLRKWKWLVELKSVERKYIVTHGGYFYVIVFKWFVLTIWCVYNIDNTSLVVNHWLRHHVFVIAEWNIWEGNHTDLC